MLGNVEKITIVGTGLLGASIGLALKARGYQGWIVGHSRRSQTALKARDLGCIDEAQTDLASAVSDTALIIVCVPLGAFATVFKQIAPSVSSRVVITDVGSTKRNVIELAKAHLPWPERFVGSHPMAGSEQQGPEHSTPDLFNDKPCIVTPEAETATEAVEIVESLWRELGMRLIHSTADEHDRKAAVISHLPHALAVLLVRVAGELGGLNLASTGFRDTSRLASSNPPMRCDIMTANREAILQTFSQLRGEIDTLEALLSGGDAVALLRFLEETKIRRDEWLDAQVS